MGEIGEHELRYFGVSRKVKREYPHIAKLNKHQLQVLVLAHKLLLADQRPFWESVFLAVATMDWASWAAILALNVALPGSLPPGYPRWLSVPINGFLQNIPAVTSVAGSLAFSIWSVGGEIRYHPSEKVRTDFAAFALGDFWANAHAANELGRVGSKERVVERLGSRFAQYL